MPYETLGQRIKRTTVRLIKVVLSLAVVVGIIIISFLHWGVYDEGVWAGSVLRVSRKGVVFKSYEGQLNLQTFGALKGVNPIMESFDFSVESDRQDVVQELQAAALSGERVNLHYIERYMAFPWRGDTRFFVVKVERLNAESD